jgi:hypothetical protein
MHDWTNAEWRGDEADYRNWAAGLLAAPSLLFLAGPLWSAGLI